MVDEPEIEFICDPEHYDEDVPEPVPARSVLPEWYTSLMSEPERQNSANPRGKAKTVRACMSFLDALTMGWIVPIPIDMTFNVSPDGNSMECDSEYLEDFLDMHAVDQLGREHPEMPGPILKFVTPWILSADDGISALVMKPMNRHEDRFQPFSGVLDVDNYYGTLNAPSLWTKPGYNGTIEAGTPLVQVIPFRRDGTAIENARVREMTPSEVRRRDKFTEATFTNDAFYQKAVWEPKAMPKKLD